MGGTICIFEDAGFRKLLPLVYTRPVYELRCGVMTLREKIVRQYQGATHLLHCRDYLVDVLRQSIPEVPVNQLVGDKCLFINGRVLTGSDFGRRIPIEGPDEVYVMGDTVVAARLSGRSLSELDLSKPLGLDLFSGPRTQIEVDLITYPWDLIHHNTKQIEEDCGVLASLGRIEGNLDKGVHLLDRSNIYIAEGAFVKAGAVLDAEEGPIFIDQGAKVLPNAVIEGPVYIGRNSLVRVGAKILEGTSIGPVCKVGGEVEESIIHGYSNKQHDGFLGHSYVGMWVNLGAGTTNSDLKNNYGNVRVWVDGELVDSGSMFVGLTMGDHSKSAINTSFNTGTVVGIACNIFGSGMPPKFVPSFSWGGSEGLTTYDPTKGIEVCRKVMARRKVEMTEADAALFRLLFELTAGERESAGVR
ncbi:MAG TPA: transferase [Candidatus Latescibacteria bacterium]|nr:transferase [Candidatus Latescibacterota bacterium]